MSFDVCASHCPISNLETNRRCFLRLAVQDAMKRFALFIYFFLLAMHSNVSRNDEKGNEQLSQFIYCSINITLLHLSSHGSQQQQQQWSARNWSIESSFSTVDHVFNRVLVCVHKYERVTCWLLPLAYDALESSPRFCDFYFDECTHCDTDAHGNSALLSLIFCNF